MSDHSRSTDASREALSALVDGQARPDELSQILQAWKGDADTRAAWRDYQFVGDVMRSAELAQGTDSDRFLQNFRARLAEEPVVLAPAAARAVEPRVVPAYVPAAAPAVALRRRTWMGPTAVAAGFVMIVGAMVSALAPMSTVPAEALASSEQRIQLASQDADPSLGVAAVVPMASALVSHDALLLASQSFQPVADAGNSFSRPARASALLIRDPRLDHALGIRRGQMPQGASQDASFASPHTLSQTVVFEAP
ncbi:sigma-E factor negative regulatory protein [Aquabacterium sp.]|uniref:sigma-E factor negative regulatory protein n=1 Tax=Aquabacterium sp. TaxID=1872578 RepID=UPI0027BACAA1|nr:sigma-E factor negative regulatory protein [Aquabacterium sp.]